MIAVVGEALVDLVLEPGAAAPRAHAGGSPANVALGLARLGVPVTLLTRIGDDAYGGLVRGHLEASGVTLAPGSVVAGAATSTAAAVLDASGAASYEFEIAWDPGPLRLPEGAECLHTGSLATSLPPGADAVAALVRESAQRGVTVTYDPNVRPALVADRTAAALDVDRLAGLAHVVKVSDEDLGYLYPDRSPLDVAREWVADRVTPMLVVVTRGGQGAFAVTPLAEVTVPPPLPVPVVDTVGAGDSFMSGLIDALRRADLLRHEHADTLRRLDRSELTAVVTDAALCASITVSRAGADPPTRAELDALRPA